jgi:hypothetical protein
MATAPHPAASNTPALARSPFLLLLLCPHCGHQRFHEWCPQRVRWNGCKVYNFSSFFNFLRADFVQSPSLLVVLTKMRLFSSRLFRRPIFFGRPTKIYIFDGFLAVFDGFCRQN